MLEVAPWNGDPFNKLKPHSPMRGQAFGQNHEGMAVYLILEDQRRVDLLVVVWMS